MYHKSQSGWQPLPFWIIALGLVLVSDANAFGQDIEVELELPANVVKAFEQAEWKKIVEHYAVDGKPYKQLQEPDLYCLGTAYFQLDQFSMSFAPLLEAHKRNPQSILTIEMLASVSFRKNDTALLMKLLSETPGNVEVLIQAGNHHIQNGDSEKERERSPSHPEFFSLVHVPPGKSMANQHYQTAVELLLRAIALEPYHVRARVALCEALIRLGRYPDATEHLLMADRVETLAPEQYDRLAELFRVQSKHQDSLDAISAAIEVDPNTSLERFYKRARIYSNLERFEEAAEDLRVVFKQDHNHPTVRAALGDAAYHDQNFGLATFSYYESYVTDSNLESLAKLGICAHDLGQDHVALHCIKEAIAKSKEKEGDQFVVPSDWRFARGRALWNLEKKHDAADDLLAAFQADPENADKLDWALQVFSEIKAPHGIIAVAKACGMNGNPKKAIDLLRQVSRDWNFPVTRDHRGNLVAGHHRAVFVALAEIFNQIEMPNAAYEAWSRAYENWSPWSCWLAVRAHQMTSAERGFRSISRSKNPSYGQHGACGTAYIALLKRDAAAARTALSQFTDRKFEATRSTFSVYASGIEDAGTIKNWSTFDLLGVFGFYFLGHERTRGLRIEALLPGSPLMESVPSIRPNDRLLAVDSIPVHDPESIDLLRTQTPGSTIRIKILRNKDVFEVDIDAESARRKLSKVLTNE